MGLINKIRERSGLAVGIIATGLILFLIGGDLLSINSILLGRGRNTVGEMAGKDVSLTEFQTLLEEKAQQYRLNTNQNPDASTLNAIRNETWQQFIERLVYQEQYEALGLQVSEAELIDMVQGDHIKEDLKQAFRNEESGEFEKEKLQEYLQNISQVPPEQQLNWYNYEKGLSPTRLSEKYRNLLIKSSYVTRVEAAQAHQEQNKRIDIRFLYIPYRNLPDSGFTVSEKEARSYLKENAADYQRKEGRKLHYVTFPIVPSAEDTTYVREEMYRLLKDFSEVTNDSLFAAANSEGSSPYRGYGPDELPEALTEQGDTLLPGQTVGPLIENGKYVIYKVFDNKAGTEEHMRASHILIKPESKTDENKAKARKEANELLQKIQQGASFKDMARVHGTDGTATQGGDLGWFSRGRMVAAFEEVTFSATEKGLLPEVVETQFGFHIIKITEIATKRQLFVSTIEKEIDARDETRDEAYQKAADFATKASDTASFKQLADTMDLIIERAAAVKPSDTRIGTLSEARAFVQWLYNEAEEEDVSEVFELKNEFAVGVMISKQAKGLANYSDVAEELKEKVMQEKKGEEAMTKLKKQSGTLDELVQLFSKGMTYVYSATGLRFSDTFLRNVGSDGPAIGAAFSLKEAGSRTPPILTNNGVLLIELTKAGKAPEDQDTEGLRKQLQSKIEGRTYPDLAKAIEALGDIQDKRYKFF